MWVDGWVSGLLGVEVNGVGWDGEGGVGCSVEGLGGVGWA